MGLELCQDITEVVQSALVGGLKLLEDKWRARLPLLGDFLHGIDRGGQLFWVLSALLLRLVHFLLRSFEILRESVHVALDAGHGLHVPVVVTIVPKGSFDILFDFVR